SWVEFTRHATGRHRSSQRDVTVRTITSPGIGDGVVVNPVVSRNAPACPMSGTSNHATRRAPTERGFMAGHRESDAARRRARRPVVWADPQTPISFRPHRSRSRAYLV